MAVLNVVSQGSSTTEGYGVTSSYSELWAAAHPAATFTLVANSGDSYNGFIAEEATVNTLRELEKVNVYVFQLGSNDIDTWVPNDLDAGYRAHLQRMRVAGWYIVLVNQLPSAGRNEYRNTYLNPFCDTVLSEGLVDAVMAWGYDSEVGADENWNNPEVTIDGQHPTQEVHQLGCDTYLTPILDQITKPRYIINW